MLQGVLFLHEKTLEEKRGKTYTMLKFYKQLYEDVETSYKIKYAVEDTLRLIRPDDINIGEAVKKVLQHPHLRGKFTLISEYFKDMGVT